MAIHPARQDKSKIIDPFLAFETKMYQICDDLRRRQHALPAAAAKVFNEDAREIKSVPDRWGDIVVTSPPYANNYDYADATRLEMTFWGDINGWSDLQESVRKNLVRACTQHVSSLKEEIDPILYNPMLDSIRGELLSVYSELKSERLKHGGKKNYHLKIAAYFVDLAKVIWELRRVTSENCLMCFFIGDSAPYGVYVPVDQWLGKLSIAAGFKQYSFEKLRDRNTKWKNRKHRIPLHEGRLWIEG